MGNWGYFTPISGVFSPYLQLVFGCFWAHFVAFISLFHPEINGRQHGGEKDALIPGLDLRLAGVFGIGCRVCDRVDQLPIFPLV